MFLFNSFSGNKHKPVSRLSPRRTVLNLHQLEDRLVPVVGAFGVPAAIAPLPAPTPQLASPYDGVVRLETTLLSAGTASLIQTGNGWGFGHQILTAAHGIAKGVKADPGGSPIAVRFDLSRGGIPVPITINVPKNIDGGAQYQVQHSAYVNSAPARNDLGLLVLTDQVASAPDRLLVAPFSAQQYSLFNDGVPTQVNGVPAEVTQQFTMVGYGLTGVGATGSNMLDGTKRAGQNRFDATADLIKPGWTEQLVFDFDRLNDPGGRPNIDTLGLVYQLPDAGLGVAEADDALGDSGGPAFVGANLIAGVMSSGTELNLVAPRPSGFGDVGYFTNVSKTIGDAALQQVLTGAGAAYDVVLDMNQQVYGRSNPGAGGVDTLTIHARNVGGNLELWVTGTGASADSRISGMYYRAPASNIKSLTIRGSEDNETIIIEGALGLRNNGSIYVDGRGGSDTLLIEDTASPDAESHYVFGAEPGWATSIYHAGRAPGATTFTAKAITNVTNVERYRLVTGAGDDYVQLNQTSSQAGFTGTEIYTNAGSDNVIVGSALVGLLNVYGMVFVDTTVGENDRIPFDDANTNRPGVKYTLDGGTEPTWDYGLRRPAGGSDAPLFQFKNADCVNIQTGTQADTVVVAAAPDISGGTFVYTNAGDDTVVVGSAAAGLADILGGVWVDAGSDGRGTVMFNDAASEAEGNQYTLSAAPPGGYDLHLDRKTNGQLRPTVGAKRADQYVLLTSKKADIIAVDSVPAAPKGVSVFAGAGDDLITVGKNTSPGLDKLAAIVTVYGEDGTNTLTVDNRTAAIKQLIVTKFDVLRADGERVEYDGIKFLVLMTDGGAGNVNVMEKAAGVDVKVVLQGGANAVPVSDGKIAFELGGGPNWITVTSDAPTDRVTVADALAITILPTFAATPGQVFTLIDNQTSLPILGTFDGLPEGSTITAGGWTFVVSYIGHQNPNDPYTNDVILTTATVPASSGNTASVSGVVEYTASGTTTVLPGFLVTLVGANGNSLQTVTDLLGGYLFSYLPAGVYTLLFDGRTSYGPFTLTTGQTLADIEASLVENVVPVAIADAAATNEDTAVTVAVRANDTDANGDPLKTIYATGGAHGSTAVNANGSVTYTPDADWNGTDTFTYTIDDGFGGKATGTVTVTVAAVDDAPVARDQFTMTPADVPTDIDLWALVTDVETNPTTLTFVVASALHGTVLLLPDGHTARFTPAPGYHGPATFSYTATDPVTTLTAVPATVTVSANTAPTAADVSTSIHAGGTFSPPLVWTDLDGDMVTLTAFTATTAHGTVVAGPGGMGLVYTPASAAYTGDDTFTYTVSDGHGGTSTGTVTVHLTNTPPTAADLSITLHAGGSTTALPLYMDMDGDTVTMTGYTQGQHGSVTQAMMGTGLVYAAASQTYTGDDYFDYTVSDGHGGTATGRVTIHLTNLPPVANNVSGWVFGSSPYTVMTMAYDPDGDTVTVTAVTQPPAGSGTVSLVNGQIVYTPPTGFSGTVVFYYTVSDGHGGTATASVTLTVS